MCQSFHQLYSRLLNKNRGDSFTHNKVIENRTNLNTHGQLYEWCKIISNDSSPRKKKHDMDNRRPSDEENLCPPEHLPPATQKKHAKLKYANSSEWEPNKRAKLSEESPPSKETRKKREKGMNGDKHLTESRRLASPSTRHRRTNSFDGNCLKSSGNKRPLVNGEVSRTHSNSIDSQNTQTSQKVSPTEIRSHNGSCPSLRSTPSPSPDLPPKHPSHLLRLNSEHRHRHNGLLPNRGPSPLPHDSTTSEDSSLQSPGDVTLVKTEAEPSNQKAIETTRSLDIRRAILSVKKRSFPTKPLIESIYSENRRLVTSSEKTSTNSVPTSNKVLYRQPNESPRYYDDIFSYKQKRPQLIKLLQTRILAQYNKEYLLCMEQDRLQEEWDSVVQECNESEAKKSGLLKMREQYERFYPELRRQREQERIAKATGNGETEVCEENSLEGHESVAAVIPAMIIDPRERDTKFLSRNGYIADLSQFTEQIKSTNIWTEEEKSIFKEQFHQSPKNFEQIASFLKNKSVSECIHYYYLNKRQVNFKQSLKGANGKRRKHRLQAKDSMYLYVKPRGTSLTSPDTQTTPRQRRTPDPDWTPDDVEKLKNALFVHGRSWNKVQQVVGRSHVQCKMFFNDFSSIEEYGLQQAIEERSKLKAKERQERLANDSEDPLPPLGRNFSDELSDPDSPPRLHTSPPPPPDTPQDVTTSHLLDHSYASLSAHTPTHITHTTHPHSTHSPTLLTHLSPAMHARLTKCLRESCLGKPARSRKPRRNSAAALLQPSNHRKLSSGQGQGQGADRRTPLRQAPDTDPINRAAQERSASDTYMDQQSLIRTSSYSTLSTPTESKASLVSEVVTETDTQTPDTCDKPEVVDSSEYDSDQEGGRLVIDIDADDIIEEAPPATQGGSFSSLPDLPDLTERVDEPEVFQSEDTSPSELSADLTELSPTPQRFQDAWAYRDSRPEQDTPEIGPTSAQLDKFSDQEPRRVETWEGDALSEIISKLELPLSDRPPKKKWNHFTLPPPRKPEPIRPIPTKYGPTLPKAIHQSLKILKSQDGDHKRNVPSAQPKESQKRFKQDSSHLANGAKEETADESKADSLRLLAQYRPELVQQPRYLSYPLYHPMGQFFLQGQYLPPHPGKLIYPPGLPITLTKQQEQLLVQNPLSSYPPSLLLPGSGLYPLPYAPALSQEGGVLQQEGTRGATNKHLERP